MKFRNVLAACCIAAFAFALPAGAANDSDGIVVVRQGQNLRAIAAQHKVTVAQLCEWNKLSSPDKIQVGQKLHIRSPGTASGASGAYVSAAPSPSQSAKHVKHAAPAAQGPAQTRAPDGVPEKVKLELADVGKTLVHHAAKNIMPNSKSKAVAPGGDGGYVASYIEVDVSDIRTEVMPSAESGKYVGSIRYVEKRYECPGKSRADALQAECRVVKSRRMNELIRYEKGKWHY